MLVDLEIDKITTCTTLLIAMPSPSERIFCFYKIPKYQTWCLIPFFFDTELHYSIKLAQLTRWPPQRLHHQVHNQAIQAVPRFGLSQEQLTNVQHYYKI
jgi:hypothetical protein